LISVGLFPMADTGGQAAGHTHATFYVHGTGVLNRFGHHGPRGSRAWRPSNNWFEKTYAREGRIRNDATEKPALMLTVNIALRRCSEIDEC
jgi:hypothetical protein